MHKLHTNYIYIYIYMAIPDFAKRRFDIPTSFGAMSGIFQSHTCLIRLLFMPYPPLKIQQGSTIISSLLSNYQLAQWKKNHKTLIKEQWSDIYKNWWIMIHPDFASNHDMTSWHQSSHHIPPPSQNGRLVLSSPTSPEEVDPWRCEMLITCGYCIVCVYIVYIY